MPDEEYITAEEAAKESGYTVRHIQKLLKSGRIPGKRFGRAWMLTREAVMAYKAANPQPGRPKQAG